MTLKDIQNFSDDLFENVFSENLVGIDFIQLYAESALFEIVKISEELGLYHIDCSSVV